ncbi:MAG: hypothetical protein RL196_549 [Actinomycetota bacterium]|jgi:Ca-activated chloride channel family protein
MNNIKIEYQQIKADSPASIGLMVELNAPASPDNQLIARAPRGVVFVVDRSGSMGGGRLEVVKSTILDILGQLDKNDYLSIVTFDHAATVELPLTRIQDADLKATRKLIGELSTGGSTNLERGYRIGLAEAASAPSGVEVTVVLLSDGHANQGNTEAQSFAQLAAGATEHFIKTSTLGIGEAYDERLLVEMSNTGKGNHFAAVDFAEAALGLNTEISELLTRTVSGLSVTVRTEGALQNYSHTRTPQYVHKTTRNADHSIRYELGAMGSLEERNFVAEIAVQPIATNFGNSAGRIIVSVEYLDEVAGQQIKLEKAFDVELIEADKWVEPARDEDIVMELATLRSNTAKEQAIELARQGRMNEAQELLNQAGVGLEALANSMHDLSPRNRARADRYRRELNELANMDGELFIKRSTESHKRGMNSKIDPRQAPKQDDNTDESEA